MAKVITQGTRSPYLYQAMTEIFSDDVQHVVEALNYAFARNEQPLLVVNPTGQTSTDFNPHIERRVSSVDDPFYSFWIYVPPDYADGDLTISACCRVDASTTSGLDVDYTIGAATGTIQCDTTLVESTATVSIDTAMGGGGGYTDADGWLLCDVDVRKDVPADGGTDNFLVSYVIQIDPRTVGEIPDPPSGDF